ncbi:hypothetical protein [Peterkaempfera griseoplana]|nr:hypothetical protein [Peterkaempfera griseoplana]
MMAAGDFVSSWGCELHGMTGLGFGEWSGYICVAVQEPGDNEPWYRLYVW